MRRPQEADFLNLYLDPALISQIAQTATSAHSFEIRGPEDVFQDQLILQIGFALRAEMDATTAHVSLVYVESLANTLAAHLFKRFSKGNSFDFAVPGRHSTVCMRQVVEYIHSQLHQPLTLTELAGVANLSPHHFARVFKQATGVSPHQYILQARIEQAKTRLLKQDVPLATIATELGFVDQSHFTRAFKRLVGMTPHMFLLQRSKNLP